MTHGEMRDKAAIDWAELRERIELATSASSATAGVLSEEDARSILDARARALSRPLRSVSETVTTDVLVFIRGNERYAIDLAELLEVHRPRMLTPLPGADHPVLGLVAWRGRALTVVDVGHPVSGTPGPVQMKDMTRVLVVDHLHGPFGILANDVLEVMALADHDMLAVQPDRVGGGLPLRGVTKDGVTMVDTELLARRISIPDQQERNDR